ncbi:LacI family DNA-binding transcriptional regulator [Nakamurella sp. GG22]
MHNPRGPRAKRPTLADVAAAAGVSVPLVSIVMRDVPGASAVTRERVRKVADELGYRPDQRARLLRQQRSRLLGVTFEVEQAFHGDLIGGIYAVAEPAGYEVVLSAIGPTRPEARAIDALLDDRCEAVILLGPRSATRALAALAAKLPVVTVARTVRSGSVDTVRTDDHSGMNAAVGHLVELGHRRIAYLDGGSTPGAPERLHALNAAVAEHLPADGVRIVPAGPGEEDGVTAVDHLLATGAPPTAVIAFNDRCAIGVIGALNRDGMRVPQDISVIGYDDSRLARISYIDLTTVGQNPRQLAQLAVQRAIDRLDNRPIDRRDQVVTPQLVIRSTTAPPRSGNPAPPGRVAMRRRGPSL